MPNCATSDFKKCPMCGTSWESRDTFLADPDISFNGYQADFGITENGLFFFTHNRGECGSTMALFVRYFESLYQGPRYVESLQGTADCPHYCLDKQQMERCTVPCKYAYVREITNILRNNQKERLATSRY